MSDLLMKPGDSFVFSGQAREDDKITPKPLTGMTLKAQVRDKRGNLVADLTYAVIDEAQGLYTLAADGGTDNWPEGVLRCDLREVVGGFVRYTETITIAVEDRVTLP